MEFYGGVEIIFLRISGSLWLGWSRIPTAGVCVAGIMVS